MNRGSVVALFNVVVEGYASMRPRFMNRGSQLGPEYLDKIMAASMRPRFMNRGSEIVALSLAPCDLRFNEAPIHESGKS